MEACVGAHHLSRKLQAHGHDTRLMPAKYVRAYSKAQKNDFRDAEAIAEAVQRPTMKFVATKTADQLDLQALHRVRERLVRQRTGIINQIRAFLLERGIAVRQGLRFLRAELPSILAKRSDVLSQRCKTAKPPDRRNLLRRTAGPYKALRQIEKQPFGRHMDFVVAWPHDAGTRDKSSGQYLRDLYNQHGLRMMHEHAQMLMKDGAKSNSLEGSIQSIITAERTGKLRIARSCPLYLEERRLYHRDAHGEVVKVRDDVLSAARYGIMTTRHWKSLYDSGLDRVSFSRPLGGIDYSRRGRNTQQTVASGVDFDVFGTFED